MYIPSSTMDRLSAKLGLRPEEALLFAGGPLAFAYMTTFGAKAAFALYYKSYGRPVPRTGAVQVRWFTNDEVMSDGIPDSYFATVGPFSYLEQGIINSKFDFEYGIGKYSGKDDVTLVGIRSREAFMHAAFVVEEASALPFSTTELATFYPGDLAKPTVDKVGPPISKEVWIEEMLALPDHSSRPRKAFPA
jgi:hypothetical protein